MGSGDSNPHFVPLLAQKHRDLKPGLLPLDATISANEKEPHKSKTPSKNAFARANGRKYHHTVPGGWQEQAPKIADQCHCTVDEIEDIYPCTPLQEGMMALTLKDSTAYTVMYKYHLPHSIDIDRLRSAWDQAAEANPILRTRIVPTQHSNCMQVVLQEPIPWVVCEGYNASGEDVVSPGATRNSDEDRNDQSRTIWQPGSPLARLIWDPSAHILTALMHHALCDDWSMRILLHDVDAAYQGQVLVPRPFRPLIEYIEQSKDRSAAFWREKFDNAHQSEMTAFPSLPIPGYNPILSQELTQTFPCSQDRRLAFPINAKIRLAWAMLQSLYTRSGDVLFGAIDTGRGIPLKGIDELSGPALVCVPVRVQLQPQQTIADALKAIQYQYADTMEFAHIGLQHLMHLGLDTAAGCRFNTLLAVEPEHSDPVPSIFKHNWEIQKTYDTYPLILRCRPSSRSLTIQATFDPAILEPQQTNRILHQLANIYSQLEGQPELKLSEVDILSPKDRQSLSTWNLPIPSMTTNTVPELIHEMALKQPQETAICSWDGNLTYDQLDRLSQALMIRFKKHGVAPGVFVPLCLEKSMWMGLAMIGVMKAGGAFVLLDPSYPVSRLRQMCDAVKSSLVASTSETRNLASRLGPRVLVIDEEDPQLLLQQVRTCDGNHPIASCSTEDPMYATFTSGSTGAPKGVVVEQGGYATSATAHAEQYNFTPHSRVLQFASPGFDSCIIEHISTLIKGGCVCVPNGHECHSRLAHTINKYSVNNACLTPSVARILTPEDLPTLQDLALVGEPVLDGDIARWEPFVHLRNAYGPAECSAVFSVQPSLTEHDPKNIGFPTGGVGWVVHPDDSQILMPVGSTGELLIEGPIVGPGYISNPLLTAQTFIHPPKWRRQFGDVHGRMYKTGDLVQTTDTGSFRYLGRKDTQVKLHGQRIELGEIEHLLQSIAFTDAPQVVVEIVQHNNVHPPVDTLTAFICWPAAPDVTNDQELDGSAFLAPNDAFRQTCTIAESRLSNLLPSFMVPKLFLPVDQMPLTPSGKLNRRQLRADAGTLSADTMKSYRAAPCSLQPPSTPEEVLLQSIWAQVLNKSADDIGVTESFFNLGGDSVSAMQVGANCQTAGYTVSVADIFQFPTIAQLAHNMKPASSYHPNVTKELPEDTWFRLSPVQQLFFEVCPDGHNRFTQQFLLRLSILQERTRIWKAIEAIVLRHSMLRAQFRRSPAGIWEQRILKYSGDCFIFREHTVQRLDSSIKDILLQSQSLLDIGAGRLLVVDLITTPTGEQYISLMAHHLVIDLVSWRVLLQDLEDFLAAGTLAGPTPLTFQQWCHLQEEYVAECLDPRKALPTKVPPAPLSYWGGQSLVDRNTWSEAKQHSFTVSPQVTQAILGSGNDAFRTRPVELMHAALLYSFLQIFDDRKPPALFTEGHGREPWDSHIDLSRTVGWFTTLAPVWAPVSRDENMSTFVLRVKEARRGIPSNGWTYFSSRYLHPQGRHYHRGQSPMEILFNYTGLFQQLERQDALLELAAIPDHGIIEMPEDMPRFALIDVSAVVMNGQLNISFMYNRHMCHQDKLEKWFHECERTFEDLPKALKGHRQLAPSDFPLLSIGNDGQFEKLMLEIGRRVHLSEIEDIYPCSPAQTGMWLSQTKDPQKYWSRLQWSLYPSTDLCTPVSITQVKQAWQKVVDLHPILRTVFVIDPSLGCEPLQVVLKAAKADIEDCEGQTWAPADEMLPLLVDHRGESNMIPAHRLKVHTMPDDSVRCELVINHMLVDGYTQQIFLKDLQRAYDDLGPQPVAPPYSDYIAYIHGQSEVESKAYWQRYLDGVQPCLFPRLSVSPPSDQKALRSSSFTLENAQCLRHFCQRHATTIPNLFQVAWGLLLQAYTGSDNVCFGFLVSARDIPLPDVQEIAGPIINLLVCRHSFDQQELISSTLSNSQVAYGRGLDNRHSPLTDIIHSLGLTGRPLFNTALSLQRANDKTEPSSPSTVIRNRGGCDATEYDLTLNLFERENTIEADLSYWSYMLTELQAELITATFQHIVSQLVSGVLDQLGQLDLVSQLNRDCIMDWNKQAPVSVRSCIHDEIGKFAIKNPSSPAVAASDGSLTYAELDQFSTILAGRLSQYGVGPGVLVPLYADKSRWVIVGVLGVLKAGGAFVLLDPCHPMERLREIVKSDLHSQLILTCARLASLAGTIADTVIVLEWLGDESNTRICGAPSTLERVCPGTAAYAVFTSGSSGKPKASVVGHECYVTGARAHSKAFGLAEGSRVLQFASFAFDASVMEILTTLMVGGCICIPSDKDRQERLLDFIQDAQVNWALLTPSVARTLDPEKAAPLKTLVLGGESLSPADVQKWSPYVKLMSAYGPSECSVIATVQDSTTTLMNEPTNIGRPTGARAWITDRYISDRLVPVGAVGELLIEGPIVGQGYIGRPELTAATFIYDMPWMKHVSCSQRRPLYKTGDLVRMLTDGTIIYMGRKDRQVKLRGQRIELAEVEYHVRQCFPGMPDVFADVVPNNDADQAYLIAAVSQPTQDEHEFASAVSITESQLQQAVPPFMRPSFLLRLQEVPRLPSGKVDRSRIRQQGIDFVQKQRDECNSVEKDWKATDLSPEEQTLRGLWSELLHCRAGAIGPDDDFFSLGGDSITAMKLVSAARAQGLHVAVADVFAHSQLRELASSVAGNREEPHGYEPARPLVAPFSLIPNGREAEIQNQASVQCSIDQVDIEDIYPCTAMQAGMAALTAERAGAYVAHHEYSIPSDINLERLRYAWEKVVTHHPILRTRLIQTTDLACWQVVVRNQALGWTESWNAGKEGFALEGLDAIGDRDDGIFGVPLFNVRVSRGDSCKLTLTMHHAVYDAWTLPQFLHCAHMAYISDEYLPADPVPFQQFIAYTCSQVEDSLAHWRTEFNGLDVEPFPMVPSISYRAKAISQVEHYIPIEAAKETSVTRTAAVRLAWALVQAQYQSKSEIVYGVVSSGRAAPLPGVEAISGPTLCAFPLRVSIDTNEQICKALKDLQTRTAKFACFEHVGLQQIAKLGPEAMRACSFQTLLNVEPAEDFVDSPAYKNLFDTIGVKAKEGAFASYAVVLNCVLKADSITVTATFDDQVISRWKMGHIISQFSHILQGIYQRPQSPVRDILGELNPSSMQQLKTWNVAVPGMIRETVPGAIQQQCSRQPLSPAVCAWDGSFTYRDLDRWSNKVATILQRHKIHPKSLVPVLMDRSRWVMVAMLGIIRAGAAFVLLEPSNASARLRLICNDIQASIILTTAQKLKEAQALVSNTLVVDGGLEDSSLSITTDTPGWCPSPNDALYCVFTSGSTGKPKGIIINHGPFVTMSQEYARRTRITPDARILHFGSYAFDVSILETLSTLIAGACVCVPSEAGRKERFAEAVQDLRPSHALLTPSLARVLPQNALGSVHTLMLVGEAARRDDFVKWTGKLRLMNLYGPAECTILSCMQSNCTPETTPASIGHPVASIGWITDPRNPYQLVPIGAVGELVLQGPLLGRGYLNDPDQTAAAFFRGPAWLDGLGLEGNGTRSMVYRTGDLVCYEDDGSLVYHGRKDTQAKLRGQRLELQEVEEQIQRSFPGILTDVVAEIVTPIDARGAPCLVAFLAVAGKGQDTARPPEHGEHPLDIVAVPNFSDHVKTTESRLSESLPDYMVPSIFVPLRQMPRTVGGKVDRRGLRQVASSMTRQQLGRESTSAAPERQKTVLSDTERLLQSIWARALGISPENIGAEDSFFRLGGDSISAMQATSQARAAGIEHAVADLFQWKSISRIVEKFAQFIPVRQATGHQAAEQDHQEEGDISAGVETSSTDNAEELLPCTPVQRGILLTQMQDPLSYSPHFIWKIQGNSDAPVDVDRLAGAWQQTVARHCALRVVFENDTKVDSDGFQLRLFPHIDAPIYILPESPVDSKGVPGCLTQEDVRRDSDIPHQFTICGMANGVVFCRLDINHAIIDATSVSLLVQDLMSLYDGQVLPYGAQDAYREYLHFVHKQPQEPARAYWSSYLMGLQPLSLPYPWVADDRTSKPLERLEVPLACSGSDINMFCRQTDWTASNLLYFAWAMALGVFSGSDDVCFGALTEGRHVPVQNIQYTVGQIANMAVCRVRLTSHLSLDQAALSLQDNYGHILSYQTFPLSEIARAAGVTVQELASTAINVQYALPDTESKQSKSSLTFEPIGGLDPTSQDIMLYVLIDQHGDVRVSMSYRPSRVSTVLATQLADYFAEAISLILRDPRAKIGDLHLLSANDHKRLLRWNAALHEPQPQCVHQAITQCAQRHPSALAVCGFDGSFSYAELESQSTQLAACLVAQGVTPTTYVPLCFEKSRWTAVAMLAVMKAGGTFVPLDPTHPITRLQELCRRVDARFVLTSVAQASMGPQLAADVIVVGDRTYDHYTRTAGLPAVVDPEQPAYVLFTSGTTGSPKGVMVPHVSFISAAQEQMRAFSLGLGSRVLQFSSYAFDVSVMEVLTTLMAGGTVCVISESERSRMLLDGVCPITVTHAFVTPSIAGMLDAGRASWVETLVLLGEPMSTSHIQQWANSCYLMNAYGPTECSVLNTATSRIVPGCDPKDMGYALGVHFWVVDQNDYHRLLPIGAVGELIVGGPPVAKGYINDPKRTADAFIAPPGWLQSLFPKDISSWRLYKTGDLVRYDISDGTLRYEGRKDRQIKVRGQRVELEDIEYHTAQCFPGAADVVVEQIMLPQDPETAPGAESSVHPRIVACVHGTHLSEQSTSDSSLERDLLTTPSREFDDDAAIAVQRLRDVLPSFMVPDLFLPMVCVPRQKSGKTDRRRLREAIVALRSKDRTSASSTTKPSKGSPQTATEKKFQVILSQLLKIPLHNIGIDDSLFHLGGDSIIAMKIAAHAQASGLDITPHKVLRDPTIRGWACAVDGTHPPTSVSHKSTTISLVADSDLAEVQRVFFNKAPPFSHDNVQSVLPVLDSQSYYLDSSSIVNFAELFPTSLDTNRLRKACSTVVSQYSILRTVFVTVDHQFFQVILRSLEPEFTELEVEDPEAYLQLETKRQATPSTPLGTVPVSFSVLTSTSSTKYAFIARISHAQYDGACLPILWNAIKSAYNGEPLPAATELTDVVHHRLGNEHPRSISFWSDYLRGASPTALDPLCITSLSDPSGDTMSPTTARREIRRPVPMAGATVATLIKAALAWLFARYQSQYDIILGQVVHGRGSDLPNIDKVFGPCLTFLPIRVTIDPSWTVSDLLRHTQAQQVATVPHDTVALRDIVRQCTDWPENAKFGCLVHHQPLQSANQPLELGGLSSYSNITWASSRPPAGQIDVISIERHDSLDLVIASPANVLDQTRVEWMADRLSDAIELFCQFPDSHLTEIEPDRVDSMNVSMELPPSLPSLLSSAE